MKNKTNNTDVVKQTNQDFKNALLVVSVVLNLFVLTTWLVARESAQYASQLAGLL